MNFSPAQEDKIAEMASRQIAEAILEKIDIEQFVTIPIDMVEQATGLGAIQIGRRMTVRSLPGRKKGIPLKEFNNYLRSIETPPPSLKKPA